MTAYAALVRRIARQKPQKRQNVGQRHGCAMQIYRKLQKNV